MNPGAVGNDRGRRRLLTIVLILTFVAIVLRAWVWPARYQILDVDEPGYLGCSLFLAEGLTPGYKPSPAGPQIWLGWAYAMANAAAHVVVPGPEELAVPLQVRPFVAMNHALFDGYRDMSGMRYLVIAFGATLAVASVAAAARLGAARAGVWGAVLAGGLVAAVPQFVMLSVQARPYSAAWSFGTIALYFAGASTSRRAPFWAAVFLGLSVGSRVESLCLVPLVWWEVWNRQGPGRLGPTLASIAPTLARLSLTAAATSLLVAPWLLTGLMGNLRAIATIQFSKPPMGETPPAATIVDFAFNQGVGPAAVLALAGAVGVAIGGRRLLGATLAAYLAFLFASMFKSTGYGLHHKGPVLLAAALYAPLGLAAFRGWRPQVLAAVVALAVALPVVQTVRQLGVPRSLVPVETVSAWLERHVPAGTVVHLSGTLRNPLPTAEASLVPWREVTAVDAWERKFQSGLTRFKLETPVLPRALSEEHLVQEKGGPRSWFILGGRPHLPIPRFDIRQNGGPVFGTMNPAEAFRTTGGILVWRERYVGPPPAVLGTPVAQLPRADGMGASIYCSDDVKLIDFNRPPDAPAELSARPTAHD